MRKIPIKKQPNKIGVSFEKDGEKNGLVLMKESDGFFINIGTKKSAKGMGFTRDELLVLAEDIKSFAKNKGEKPIMSITITAHWRNEPEESFEAQCMIGTSWDEESDDDDIFYYFQTEEEVLDGTQDFVVEEYTID